MVVGRGISSGGRFAGCAFIFVGGYLVEGEFSPNVFLNGILMRYVVCGVCHKLVGGGRGI